jgi:putative tryptophan/tyrosine transport system substrate-binding protein
MPVIGFFGSRAPGDDAHLLAAFRLGLKEAGRIEGQNAMIEFHLAENRYKRLPAMAADLVRRQVAVICANGPAAQATKAATATIPIVFTVGFDPGEVGLVTSLNRPGGNVTGLSILDVELGPKRLELLHELIPSDKRRRARQPGRSRSCHRHIGKFAGGAPDARTAAADLVCQHRQRARYGICKLGLQQHLDALVIGGDPFFNSQGGHLGALSVRHAVPTIFNFGDLFDSYRQVGIYAGRILNGEKPADLPVQQATKAELNLNLKTAKAFGLIVPNTLIGRADKVIE